MNSRSKPLREVATFFAITLGLSWLVFWGPLALFQITAISFVAKETGPAWAVSLFMLNGFMPSLVAIALTGVWEGKAGLKRLWQRTIQVKLGWRCYLAAVGFVIFGTTCQIILQALLGHNFDLTLFLAQLPSFLPLIVIGPLSEELGWRGYAQDRLQTRWNPLFAAVIVGTAWALWHFPLFLMPGTSQHELSVPFAGFLFGLIGNSVLFAWLQNEARGSIWMAVFFHWVYTYAAQVVASGVTRSPLYNVLEYTPYLLAALVVAVLWRGQTTEMVLKSTPAGD